MGESLINLTEGTGKKLHTWQRTIGANNVEDSVMLMGQPHQPTYVLQTSAGTMSTATSASHLLQIMAGSSLHVYVHAIWVDQVVLAGAAANVRMQIMRLSSAGSGGSSAIWNPMETGDAAAGATAQTLPSSKGTETLLMWDASSTLIAAVPSTPTPDGWRVVTFDFDRLRGKPLRIPAGTSNGLAVKIVTGVATATVTINAIISELSY